MDARLITGLSLVLAGGCGRFGFSAEHDASTADIAPPGAGDAAIDATTDSRQSLCSAAFPICDEFETPTLASIWTPSGMVSHDTSVMHRGSGSLRLRSPALQAGEQGGAYLVHTSDLIKNATTLWVRAWYRTNGLPAATNALEVIALLESGNLGDYVFLRADDTELYHQFDGKNAGAGTPPPLNTWFCLVWKIVLSTTATGSSELTSDVIPAISITSSVTQSTPVLDGLFIGPFFAGTNVDVAQPAFDIWLDDVIVSPTVVTCAD